VVLVHCRHASGPAAGGGAVPAPGCVHCRRRRNLAISGAEPVFPRHGFGRVPAHRGVFYALSAVGTLVLVGLSAQLTLAGATAASTDAMGELLVACGESASVVGPAAEVCGPQAMRSATPSSNGLACGRCSHCASRSAPRTSSGVASIERSLPADMVYDRCLDIGI
jgi:hypothetical protein